MIRVFRTAMGAVCVNGGLEILFSATGADHLAVLTSEEFDLCRDLVDCRVVCALCADIEFAQTIFTVIRHLRCSSTVGTFPHPKLLF